MRFISFLREIHLNFIYIIKSIAFWRYYDTEHTWEMNKLTFKTIQQQQITDDAFTYMLLEAILTIEQNLKRTLCIRIWIQV